ncbi:MAG: ABC transporter substrate-binding protein [Oscillospiraceae bacterium]|nr:ABC transporter substrate-binding protein [Oscillospiraceae bacterium]MDD6503003.1 ABC transporter substrate-binding protein [Oscillospiraceae bacterium]MDY4104827.1 ABC transporter substrate-binding protein [Oscillospiraceae bacterium]
MKKRIIALVLVLCLALTLCACGGSGDGEKQEASGNKTVVIGVYEPLSGDNGAGGKQEVLGMQYANYKFPTVEINGETYDVKLEISDNESSNDKAVSAATKLVSAGASVVLGSYGSSVAIAGSDTFADAGIPAIGVTCTNPQVTLGNDHYFRICFLDPFQGTVLANFAYDELGAQTVYCLGQLGNDYDQGLINYFSEAAKALGMTVITESFPEGNSDFNSYLTNAKNQGADVIFAPTSISYAQLIVEQAAAQGLTIPLVASDTWDSNVVMDAAQGKDLDIYVSTFYAEGGDPEFEAGIKEWINADSTNLSNNGGNDMLAAVTVMGYDAYLTALEALKAAGTTDPGEVMAVLPSVTATGITGEIKFGENGDADRNTAFIKTANTETGVWDFVTVQSVA